MAQEDLLFHYTSAIGLKGIIESKTLWATEYRFLNDSSEYRYGRKFLFDAFERRKLEIASRSRVACDFVSQLIQVGADEKTYAFVASLSTQGDLLSQWRGYNSGRGFCVGIDRAWLEQNAQRHGFVLRAVIYDESQQAAAADAVVDGLLDVLSNNAIDPSRLYDALRAWWMNALQAALRFKSAHFSEEHEHRIMMITNFWPSSLRTRASSSGITPYVECKLDGVTASSHLTAQQNCGLCKIIIGPALRNNQRYAIDALQASQHMRFSIESSEIPYIAD